MVIYRTLSGYGDFFMLRKHIGLWDGILESDSPMRFLSPDIKPEYLIDIILGEHKKDLEVIFLPSTDKKLAENIYKEETKIREVFAECCEQISDRSAFTINTATWKPIVEEDFKSYSPPSSGEYAVFILPKLERKLGGFPYMYTLPLSNCSGIYKDLFAIQAMSSLYVTKCAGTATKLGKEFTYIMLNSHLHNGFTTEKPTTDDLKLPTNGLEDVPAIYKTELLEKLLDKAHVDSVKMTGKGTKLLPEPSNQNKSVADTSHTQTVSILKSILLTDLRNRKMLNLSDIVMYGLKETIQLITNQEELVRVHIDVADTAKVMYIFGGMLYVVSYPESSSDWATTLFGSDSLVLEIDDNLMHDNADFLN